MEAEMSTDHAATETVGPNGGPPVHETANQQEVGPTGGPNLPASAPRLLRRQTGAMRIIRDQLSAAAGNLVSRIFLSRQRIEETDGTTGEAATAELLFLTEYELLARARDQLQVQLDKGAELLSGTAAEDQDFGYSILSAPFPSHAASLGLRSAPTPADLIGLANEGLYELQTMLKAAQLAIREESRQNRRSSPRDSLASSPLDRHLLGKEDYTKEALKAHLNVTDNKSPFPFGDSPFLQSGPTGHIDPRLLGGCAFVPAAPAAASTALKPTGEIPKLPPAVRFLGNARSRASSRQSRCTSPGGYGTQKGGKQGFSKIPTLGDTNAGFGVSPRALSPFRSGPRHRHPFQPPSSFETVRLQPPTFSGEPKDWLSFWTYFKRAVDDQKIPGFEKQLHLLRCLKEGSPARKAIEVYAPSDANYLLVVQLLHERYGDTQNLQRAMRAHLLHMTPAKDNTTSLTSVLDDFERTVAQLEQLGANIDDESFGPLLESKLPVRILTQMRIQEHLTGNVWSVREFRAAVNKFVKCQRSAESALASLRLDDKRDDIKSEKINPGNRREGKGKGDQTVQRVFISQPPSKSSPPRDENGRRISCSFCGKDGHLPSGCPTYSTGQKRRARAAEQKRCFVCLAEGHPSSKCLRGKKCRHCDKSGHHSLLCTEGSTHLPQPTPPPLFKLTAPDPRAASKPNTSALVVSPGQSPGQLAPISEATEEEETDEQSDTFSDTQNQSAEGQFVMKIAHQPPVYAMLGMVTVAGLNGKRVQAALLFDSGSHADFVASSLVERVQPQRIGNERICVETFGGNILKRQSTIYRLRIERVDGGWEYVSASEMDRISAPVSTLRGPNMGTPFLNQPMMEGAATPEILIGIRHFWSFIRGFFRSTSGAYCIQTVFGPIMAGEGFQLSSLHVAHLSSPSVLTVSERPERMPPTNAIERFWSLESIGINEDPSHDDDDDAVLQFRSSVRRLEDGHYSIRLPWRANRPPLPSNFQLSYRRLSGLIRKLHTTPEVLEQVQKIFDEQLELQIIEEASAGTGKREHFLPHHAVITPKKVRVVYDGSAHVKNLPCLNDCLLRGPDLLPPLAGFLLRFRACRVPCVTDVQRAFLNISLEEEDREVCKFLWLRDTRRPLTADNLVIYRFRRLPFGLTSSPFCLAAVIRHHLGQYNVQLARQLIENTYVDDILLPAESETEAIDMFEGRFGGATDDRLEKAITKVLGIEWNTENDRLAIPFPAKAVRITCTRREVLSITASVFDPLGLIGPALLAGKLFFQQLWDGAHHWDQPLEDEQCTHWHKILRAWEGKWIEIPRFSLKTDWIDLQLHVFTDASDVAFAAAVYIRSEGPAGPRSQLVFAKSRLKPKKASSALTTPRMELLGMLTGVRAAAFVRTQLQHPLSEEHLWSDSRVALGWVASSSQQPTFIANRLREIRSHKQLTFHFVRTDQNPADVATRGANPEALQNLALWWQGPEWLNKQDVQWPKEHEFRLPTADNESAESEEIVMLAANVPNLGGPVFDPKSYGSWIKAKRVALWVLHFYRQCRWRRKTGSEGQSMPIFSVEDLREAEMALIIDEQSQHPPPTNVRSDLDKQGIRRLISRIGQSAAPADTSRPVLLPKGSPLAPLIIQDLHARQLHHSGVDSTLNHFLQSFWMPGSRQMVRRTLKSCRHCRRMTEPPFPLPSMPPLPTDRVRRHLPFETIGLDYLGPTMALNEAGEKRKAWVVLITCLSIRAVYLEATRDLSALSFVNVLRRFIARRGCPTRILSDNAPHFVVTGKAISLFGIPDPKTAITEFAELRGICWRFTPQHTPWAGGVFERMVQLCKRCMQRTFGRTILPYDALNTALAEVEASINLRPITYVSDEVGAIRPLRPIDFVQENTYVWAMPAAVPDKVLPRDSFHFQLAARWQESTERVENFWARWQKEYLLILRERAGWNHKKPRLRAKRPPAIGDVVLVEEMCQPRNLWPMGRIIALKGNGTDIRSVQIQMPNGRIWGRPVNKICPLEVAPPDPEEPVQTQNDTSAADDDTTINPPLPPQEPTSSPSPTEQVEELPKEANPKADENELQTASHHGMELRRNARARRQGLSGPLLALLTLICLCFGLDPCQSVPFSSDNGTCPLSCAEKGILITIPFQVHKLELCCADGCWATSPNQAELIYELPPELMLNAYNCTGYCWASATYFRETQIRCPAKSECQMISCWLCTAQLANPSCNPRLASTLFGLLIAAFLIFVGCFWSILQRFHLGLSILWKTLAFLLGLPIRFFNWATGRRIRRPNASQLESRAKKGARRLKNEFRNARQQILAARAAQKEVRATYRSQQVGLLLAFIAVAGFVGCANGMKPVSVTTETESCQREKGKLTCTLNSATTLTLLPFGQTTSLLIKNKDGALLGTLGLQLDAITMLCMPKTEGWHRSYTLAIASSKRCQNAGMCREDYCAKVKVNSSTLIPEHPLEKLNEFPGHSFCTDSTGFWQNECFLPSACLFYRFAAKPISSTVFEQFSCPGWDVQVPTRARFEINGGETSSASIVLHPGLERNWGNLSITLLGTSLPPAPVLTEYFLTDGRSVAKGRFFKDELHCTTRQAAQNFDCTLSPLACLHCAAEHDSGTVSCHCRDSVLGKRIANDNHRLPLTTARMLLRNKGPDVWALFSYAPISVHIQFDNLRLAVQSVRSLCTITPLNLTGCFRCPSGAKFQARCHSSHDSAIAEVICQQFPPFGVTCAPNGTESTNFLALDRPDIYADCSVKCSAGTTHFVLEGQLAYVPLADQFGFHQRVAPSILSPNNFRLTFPDFGFGPLALLQLFGGKTIFIAFGVAILALLILFLAIKCHPALRIYRLLLRSVGILLLLSSLHPSSAAIFHETTELWDGKGLAGPSKWAKLQLVSPTQVDSGLYPEIVLEFSDFMHFWSLCLVGGTLTGAIIWLIIRLLRICWAIRNLRRETCAFWPNDPHTARVSVLPQLSSLPPLLAIIPSISALPAQYQNHTSTLVDPPINTIFGLYFFLLILAFSAFVCWPKINRPIPIFPLFVVLFLLLPSPSAHPLALSLGKTPIAPTSSHYSGKVGQSGPQWSTATTEREMKWAREVMGGKEAITVCPGLPRTRSGPRGETMKRKGRRDGLSSLLISPPARINNIGEERSQAWGEERNERKWGGWVKPEGQLGPKTIAPASEENEGREGRSGPRQLDKMHRPPLTALAFVSAALGQNILCGEGKKGQRRRSRARPSPARSQQEDDERCFHRITYSFPQLSSSSTSIHSKKKAKGSQFPSVQLAPQFISAHIHFFCTFVRKICSYFRPNFRLLVPFPSLCLKIPSNPFCLRMSRSGFRHQSQTTGPALGPGDRPFGNGGFQNGGFNRNRSPSPPRRPQFGQALPNGPPRPLMQNSPFGNGGFSVIPLATFRPNFRRQEQDTTQHRRAVSRPPISVDRPIPNNSSVFRLGNRAGGEQGPIGPVQRSSVGRAPLTMPISFRLQLSSPQIGQNVGEYLISLLGPNWFRNPWHRAMVEEHFGDLDEEGWAFRRAEGSLVSATAVLGMLPAREQLAWPGMTVSQLHLRNNHPLRHPDWPCFYWPGGIVGSSRVSRSRQRQSGLRPWRDGEWHADWLPIECLWFAVFDPNEEMEGAPGPFFTREHSSGRVEPTRWNATGQRAGLAAAVEVPRRPPQLSAANCVPLGPRRTGRPARFATTPPRGRLFDFTQGQSGAETTITSVVASNLVQPTTSSHPGFEADPNSQATTPSTPTPSRDWNERPIGWGVENVPVVEPITDLTGKMTGLVIQVENAVGDDHLSTPSASSPSPPSIISRAYSEPIPNNAFSQSFSMQNHRQQFKRVPETSMARRQRRELVAWQAAASYAKCVSQLQTGPPSYRLEVQSDEAATRLRGVWNQVPFGTRGEVFRVFPAIGALNLPMNLRARPPQRNHLPHSPSPPPTNRLRSVVVVPGVGPPGPEKTGQTGPGNGTSHRVEEEEDDAINLELIEDMGRPGPSSSGQVQPVMDMDEEMGQLVLVDDDDDWHSASGESATGPDAGGRSVADGDGDEREG